MRVFDKLKLAIFEASKEELIDIYTTNQMVDFCESADINDAEDRAIAGEILDSLINLTESAEDDNNEITKEKIKLAIFESEQCGDITKDEMYDLLDKLETCE